MNVMLINDDEFDKVVDSLPIIFANQEGMNSEVLEERIKSTLNYMSPLTYRKSLGLIA